MNRRCTLLGSSLAVALAAAGTAHADGCFVWDKERDIAGPTQKAILFYADGRQDLLLQVRYEGPVERFGWLIPVPGLPTVRQGSMECFYELSKLTQQRFPDPHGHRGGAPSGVRVVEIKTVGDYEVAVLSPSDAGSLDRWLSEQGYVVPTGDAGIVEEYIRAGWYFIAAKIQLNRPPRFKLATGAARSPAASRRRIADLRTKLATGELHPLLISFNTPRCVFPLRISALNGGPSEVSLYVLAAEPLLNRSILEQTLATLQKKRELWEQEQWERTRARLKMRHRSQTIRHEHAPGPAGPVWTLEELEAMERGSQVPRRAVRGWDPRWIDIHEVVATSPFTSRELPQNTKANPRLSGGTWQLTKITRTFALEEMRDLEFEPALPVLAAALPTPAGVFAAAVLAQFGDPGAASLLSACESAHPLERINASSALRGLQQALPADLLLRLLGDPEPEVRLNAAQAAGTHWDSRFIPPLLGLFRDDYDDIRETAAAVLRRDARASPVRYLGLLNDTNPKVRASAALALYHTQPGSISQPEVLQLLRDPDPDVRAKAVVCAPMVYPAIPREAWLRLLGDPRIDTVKMVLRHFQLGRTWRLTADEVAPLLRNDLIEARVTGLEVLQRLGGARAVELAMPLLRDPDPVVRKRAWFFFEVLAGTDFAGDPARVEEWWAGRQTGPGSD